MIKKRTSSKGQALAVGFLLLLGVVVIAVSWFQITQLPQINENAEDDFEDEAASDMVDLRDSIWEVTAGKSDVESVEVKTVVNYPLQGRKSQVSTAQITFNETDNAYDIENTLGGNPIQDSADSSTDISLEPNYFVSTSRQIRIDNLATVQFSTDNYTRTRAEQLLIGNDTIYIPSITPESKTIVSKDPSIRIQETMNFSKEIEPNNNSNNTIVLYTKSTLGIDFWKEEMKNTNSVKNVTKSGGRVRFELENKEYRLKYRNIKITTP